MNVICLLVSKSTSGVAPKIDDVPVLISNRFVCIDVVDLKLAMAPWSLAASSGYSSAGFVAEIRMGRSMPPPVF